jgi:hypothetical protein
MAYTAPAYVPAFRSRRRLPRVGRSGKPPTRIEFMSDRHSQLASQVSPALRRPTPYPSVGTGKLTLNIVVVIIPVIAVATSAPLAASAT